MKKSQMWFYISLGSAAMYLWQRSQEQGGTLSGRVLDKQVNPEVLVESVIPWLGIKNPIVKQITTMTAKNFARNIIGDDNSDAIEVEYRRV